MKTGNTLSTIKNTVTKQLKSTVKLEPTHRWQSVKLSHFIEVSSKNILQRVSEKLS